MDKILKPERFNKEPNTPTADKEWTHWFKTFTNFVDAISVDLQPNKLNILINYLDPFVYEYISECDTYNEEVGLLKSVKKKNVIFARHLLATRKQKPGGNFGPISPIT